MKQGIFVSTVLLTLCAATGCASEETQPPSAEEQDALLSREVEGTYVSVRKGTFNYQDVSRDPDVKGLVLRKGELYLREIVVLKSDKSFEVRSDLSLTPDGPRVGVIQYDITGRADYDWWPYQWFSKANMVLSQSKASAEANQNFIQWPEQYSVVSGYRNSVYLQYVAPGTLLGESEDPRFPTSRAVCSGGCKRVAPGTVLPPVSSVSGLSATERAQPPFARL